MPAAWRALQKKRRPGGHAYGRQVGVTLILRVLGDLCGEFYKAGEIRPLHILINHLVQGIFDDSFGAVAF